MRTAKIAIFRWAFIGCLGLVACFGAPGPAGSGRGTPRADPPGLHGVHGQAQRCQGVSRGIPRQSVRPALERPALKDFRDELGQKLTEATKDLKEKIGVSMSDLVELPQGTLAVAAIAKDPAREDAAASSLPVDVVLMADAGENEKKMLEVLERATKQGESGRTPRSRPNRSTA